MTDQLRAGPDTRVTLHFAVRLMDGTEMDSTFGGQPASFVWGDESLLPGFERALLGLKAGDKRSVYIEAAKGFGAYNPDNIQQFRADEFAEGMALETGVVVSFRDASGAELPGVISLIEDNWVTVDFNHPLAGRDLTFEVEILGVERDAPEQAVTIRS
ncbi:MAG: FKBP-type peptidyl-prolyl cis-trans isomerase [Alcanivoracaceae bacterium]|jgi:FKBP-type peptidyl-prolyl cis-trans isomerase SlpA|nr:FKBP-type peptidyl-prolyl cis-trans isomerase [Alcanivoracaceae bacterium]